MYYELNDTEKKKGLVCCFEVYDKENRCMTHCNKQAHGKKGLSLKKTLCKEHYNYAIVMIK